MSFKPTKGLGLLNIGCTFEITEIKPVTWFYMQPKNKKTKVGQLTSKTELGDLITVLYSSSSLTKPKSKSLEYQRVTVINHTKDIQTSNSLFYFQDFFNRIGDCKQI